MGALTGKQKLAWAAITLVVLLWSLFPVYSILMTSFKTQDGLFSGTLLPPEWTWENYETIRWSCAAREGRSPVRRRRGCPRISPGGPRRRCGGDAAHTSPPAQSGTVKCRVTAAI